MNPGGPVIGLALATLSLRQGEFSVPTTTGRLATLSLRQGDGLCHLPGGAQMIMRRWGPFVVVVQMAT